MPAADEATNAIALSGIRKSFDGFVALDDAHFAARWGEVHALLGENGAGKSSLMNIAAGLYAPEAGAIVVDGTPARLLGPRDAALLGIGMVHQHFKLVRPFTVAENILLANPRTHDRVRHGAKLAQTEAAIRKSAEALGFAIDPRARVGSLSIAEQQRVEILKVLLAGARILILDEPTAVLTDAEADRLLRTVHGLARSGTAVVLVTHKMADVKTYADRVTIMRGGRTIETMDPRQASTAELVKLTVGETINPPARTVRQAGDIRLRLRDLKLAMRGEARGHTGINIEVRAGEIYGIAGVGGNGQSELAAAILGLTGGDTLSVAGEIHIEGLGNIANQPAVRRRDASIAAIPADRYGVGLAGSLSVAENFGIGAAHTGAFGAAWRLRKSTMAATAETAMRAFNVQGARSVRHQAALLSGGNAQKLVIAREFSKQPMLVLAHSPSRGLDARATTEVHARLLAARDAGAAVLLISEDLDEVLSLADRIGVMARGHIVAEFTQPADRQAIGSAMVDHA
ncbi:MAG: ABC transporter ATP-binding protein [Burkholderiales bacterium]